MRSAVEQNSLFYPLQAPKRESCVCVTLGLGFKWHTFHSAQMAAAALELSWAWVGAEATTAVAVWLHGPVEVVD